MNELPQPSPEALAQSAALVEEIRSAIALAGGAIPFSRYMEMCLYTPGLGYYSGTLEKFGAAGDFVTAPEVSTLFGRCLARSCRAVLDALPGGSILEFGAGSGQLAVDVLTELQELGSLPSQYLIVERSADLRQRQQLALKEQSPELLSCVAWLDELPQDGFRGVMLANEVLDAMAVDCFRWTGDTIELLYIESAGDVLSAQWRALEDDELQDSLGRLVIEHKLDAGYVSEFSGVLQPWLRTVSEQLQQGMLLLIDYGYPQHEYYHAQHSSGTLMCHYRQRAHTDYLLWPGLQDITAHVDFTAVAEAAVNAGLEVSGYTTQTYFLLDCGLDQLLQALDMEDTVGYLKQAQQAKTLILPGEMGERFKCIGLTRGIESPVPGFRMQDFRNRL